MSTPNFFTYKNQQIAYEVVGKGKALVMLHGWGSSRRVMMPIAKSLENIRASYVLDLPGFGDSPEPETVWTISDYADAVQAFIEKLPDDNVDVLVHSFGGRIILKLLTRPKGKEVIDKVLITGGAGMKPQRSLKFYVRKYTAKILKAPFSILPNPLRDNALNWLRTTSVWKSLGSSDYAKLSGVMRETFVKSVTEYQEDCLPLITHETLLIYGRNDEATPIYQAERIEKGIKNAALVVMEGCGHYAFLDKPKQFTAIATAFFEPAQILMAVSGDTEIDTHLIPYYYIQKGFYSRIIIIIIEQNLGILKFERMISRQLLNKLFQNSFQGKAIILSGARQVGKTTLIKELLTKSEKEFLFFDGDDPTVRQIFDSPNTEQLRLIIGKAPILFIDEAQRIPNIGLTSKIIIDQFPNRQLIISGSSAFELNSTLQEPLTGRKFTYQLFPVSWKEWEDHVGYLKALQDLETRLVFGFYPDILIHPEKSLELLLELTDSYLYKDILGYAGIRKPQIIQKLVQALAFQVGQEVVYREVGELIGVDPKTVANYIDILEKAYVIFRLPAFSKNLRNEIKKNQKIYFYDNGVRNAVIHALNPLPARNDVGALWENFLISERMKQLHYRNDHRSLHFWRTQQQQEVDLVEVVDERVFGFEFKWNPKQKIRFSKTFTETYNAKTEGVHRENFRDFVLLNER